jgi:hypothetical protein
VAQNDSGAITPPRFSQSLVAMKRKATLQRELDSAFSNYLKLTDALRSDLASMLDEERPTLHWRRNFVRASAALLEGHAHCLRRVCAVGLSIDASVFSKKEQRAITNDGGLSANERLKWTLRAAYKLHGLKPSPRFDGPEWRNAQKVMLKRHRLMHPRRPNDLGIADSTWKALRRGIIWLMKQFFDFLSLLQAKYGN